MSRGKIVVIVLITIILLFFGVTYFDDGTSKIKELFDKKPKPDHQPVVRTYIYEKDGAWYIRIERDEVPYRTYLITREYFDSLMVRFPRGVISGEIPSGELVSFKLVPNE